MELREGTAACPALGGEGQGGDSALEVTAPSATALASTGCQVWLCHGACRVLAGREKLWLHPARAVAPLSPPPRVPIVTLVPSSLQVRELREHGRAHPTKGLLGRFWVQGDQRGAGMILVGLNPSGSSLLPSVLPAQPGAVTNPVLLPRRSQTRSLCAAAVTAPWQLPLCREQSQAPREHESIAGSTAATEGTSRSSRWPLPMVTGTGVRRG